MGEPVITIRKGVESDIPAIFELIKELAEYEKSAEHVKMTEAELLKHGFGANPDYQFFVAEVNGRVEAMAFYYYCFSTWKGKYLYLEDLVVREQFRKLGLGTKLFETLVEKAKTDGLRQMGWQVLDWNEPAINFYKKHKAELYGEWLNGRMYFDACRD